MADEQLCVRTNRKVATRASEQHRPTNKHVGAGTGTKAGAQATSRYWHARRRIIDKPGVALLDGVNLLAQPIGPRVHAIALCCSDGENGRLRIKILNCLVKGFPVEIEEGHRINFVQNNHP